MNRLRNGTLPALQLRDILRSPLDALPDAELLDRFARYADHDAFESLVRRHGAMVFGVCRRMLTDYADAEDAFQATFLVFIRKAHSLRRADRVGPWLYGVACRVSMKARARAARLAKYRTEATKMIPDPSTSTESNDWLPILDAELAALPAKYRDALILCELQGVSRAEAAKSLGIPEGTLSSRLSRGREMLRRRLLKHGTLLPLGGVASLLTNSIGRATVPAVLLKKTFELANIGTGAAAAGAVPVGAAQLTDAVLKTMFFTKLKLASGACVALMAVAVGLASVPSDAPGQAKADKPTAKAAALQPAAKPQAAKPAVPDRDALQGYWVLEKVQLGKNVAPLERKRIEANIGGFSYMIVGDVWWTFQEEMGISSMIAKLDTTKNPKWLDLTRWTPGLNTEQPRLHLYQLDGDLLRIVYEGWGKRPVEFVPGNKGFVVCDFRRQKLPPSKSENALVGSWEGPTIERMAENWKGHERPGPVKRVEFFSGVLDGYVFFQASRPVGAQSPDTTWIGSEGWFDSVTTWIGFDTAWIGGRYTVDTTKNPKWIDIELMTPFPDDRTIKLYGCYETTDQGLKLSLGVTGKRALRPLEFKPSDKVQYFDLKRTKEPLVPKVIAPRDDRKLNELLNSDNYVVVEKYIQAQLPKWTGLHAVEANIMLGSVQMARAQELSQKKDGSDKSKSLFREAARHFREAIKVAKADTTDSKQAGLLRSGAEWCLLDILLLQEETKELLIEATAILERHNGTIEELILLERIHAAFKKMGDKGKVSETHKRMKELFDRLPASAFTEENDKYSRAYWEKEWFGKK